MEYETKVVYGISELQRPVFLLEKPETPQWLVYLQAAGITVLAFVAFCVGLFLVEFYSAYPEQMIWLVPAVLFALVLR